MIYKLLLIVIYNIGNSGGLGGVFGIRYAINKPLPFPEGHPKQQPSLSLRLYQYIGQFIRDQRAQNTCRVRSSNTNSNFGNSDKKQ